MWDQLLDRSLTPRGGAQPENDLPVMSVITKLAKISLRGDRAGCYCDPAVLVLRSIKCMLAVYTARLCVLGPRPRMCYAEHCTHPRRGPVPHTSRDSEAEAASAAPALADSAAAPAATACRRLGGHAAVIPAYDGGGGGDAGNAGTCAV